MSKAHQNYFVDEQGNLQPERRRSNSDRRLRIDALDHDRRRNFRRKADRELYEKDHKVMIREALEDFAEEHDGRV